MFRRGCDRSGFDNLTGLDWKAGSKSDVLKERNSKYGVQRERIKEERLEVSAIRGAGVCQSYIHHEWQEELTEWSDTGVQAQKGPLRKGLQISLKF